MDDEVGRPACDERDDDAQRHLHAAHLGARHAPVGRRRRLAQLLGRVAAGARTRSAPVDGRRGGGDGDDVAALSPHDAHHVDVAERYDARGHDEDVCRHEAEVELALPPAGVAAAEAEVLHVSVRVDAHLHLLEDEQLRQGEHPRRRPRQRHHAARARTARAEAQRAADGEVAVDAHRREDERRAGERHDLRVQQQFASDGAQHPCLFERDEHDLGRHRHAADGQVPDRQIDDEDVDAAL